MCFRLATLACVPDDVPVSVCQADMHDCKLIAENRPPNTVTRAISGYCEEN